MHEKRQLIALILAAVLTVAGLAAFKKPVAYADGTTSDPEGTTAYTEGTTAYTEGTTAASEGPTLYTVTYSDGLGGSVFADYTYTDLWYGQNTPAFPYAEVNNPGYVLYGFDPPVTENVEVSVTYYAIWAEDSNENGIPDQDEGLTFTVTYKDDIDGTDLRIFTEVPYGSPTPEYDGKEPTREGYLFLGFAPSAAYSDSVKEDEIYIAKWLQITALTVENIECYMDSVSEAQRFQPQSLTLTTNYGTFTGSAESVLGQIRSACEIWDAVVPYGIQNSDSLTWEAGTHQVVFFFGDKTAEYTVTVNGSLIQSVTVSDRLFYADGSASELNSWEYEPHQISVTLDGGTVLSGTPYEVSLQIASQYGVQPEYGFEGSTKPLPFEPGDYTISWQFFGKQTSYTVSIKDISECPLASLTVEDVIVYGEYLPVEKILPAYTEPKTITVQTTDGQTFSGSPSEVNTALSAAYGFTCSYRVRDDLPSFFGLNGEEAVGEYPNTFYFGNLEADYTIQVTMLIQELEHVQLRFICSDEEGTLHPADFFCFTDYKMVPTYVKVTLFNGEQYEGFPEVVQTTLNETYCNGSMGTLPLMGNRVNMDEVWDYGAYTYDFEFMRHYGSFTIYVEQPAAVSIDTQMNYLTAGGEDENTPCDVTVDRRTNATDLLALLQAREEE